MKKKRRWFIIGGIVLLILGGVGGYFYWKKSSAINYETVTVGHQDVVQEVSVTGRVKSAQSVDLAFEQSGRLQVLNVTEGDVVEQGQVLASLNTSELDGQRRQAQAAVVGALRQRDSLSAQHDIARAQVAQAKAAVDVQQQKLDELRLGPRQEELDISQTKVTKAQNAVSDAQLSLDNVKSKSVADIDHDYNGALNEIAKAVTLAEQALFTLTDIQFAHFLASERASSEIADAKSQAVLRLYGASNYGRASRDVLEGLYGGAVASYATAKATATHANIDAALDDIIYATEGVRYIFDVVPTSQITATEITSLKTEQNNLDAELILLAGKQQAIQVQLVTNAQSQSTAEVALRQAEDALKLAQDELLLVQAGARPEQISAQEAVLRQAQADVDRQEAQVSQAYSVLLQQDARVQEAQAALEIINAKIAKLTLKAPFKGVITSSSATVGEIVNPQATIISLMAVSEFEIKVYVPEVDITKIELGDVAAITLDAYGSSEKFSATVMHIDPAEVLLEGVSTYKMILVFADKDPRIKSGMTANIDIVTDRRDSVLAVPQRSVITQDGRVFVRGVVLQNNKQVEIEYPITTGLKGSFGYIEVLSGLQGGETIILFEKGK